MEGAGAACVGMMEVGLACMLPAPYTLFGLMCFGKTPEGVIQKNYTEQRMLILIIVDPFK